MRMILNILSRAGGWHPSLCLKIENLPYTELVIEAIDEPGPIGLPAISFAHYGEQNGDLMRDPEMCFKLAVQNGPELVPFYYRNDLAGIEQWSRNIGRDLTKHANQCAEGPHCQNFFLHKFRPTLSLSSRQSKIAPSVD
jgi:hypothetical protein